MKRAISILLVLGLLAWSGATMADETATMDFSTTKDTVVSNYSTEQLWGAGGAGHGRGGKHDNRSLYDWDIPAIQTWIDAQGIPGDYYPVFEFVVQVRTAFDTSVLVNTINSSNDWTEGDGPHSFTNFDWTQGLTAATYSYAQTAYTGTSPKVLDVGNTVAWTRPSDSTDVNFWSLTPDFTNIAPLTVTAGDADTDISVVLDYALTQDLLTNANNRGLYLSRNPSDSSTNWRVYFREQSTPPDPRLRVSFSNVPLDYVWTGGTGNWS
ncbi:hypothetical protein LCGC14_2223300, partial [marine sediment metagenome]